MIRNFLVTLLFFGSTINPLYSAQTVSTGKLTEYPRFESKYVSPRDVCVWVPDGYSPKKKYDVLYMHDGQMLFDANTTWNKQEWKVDEVAGSLIAEGKIRNCIVVAVSNIPETRYGDFLPQKTLEYLPEGTDIPKDIKYNADNYLRFHLSLCIVRVSGCIWWSRLCFYTCTDGFKQDITQSTGRRLG